ncbi:MAG: hypothetical protein ABIR68_19800 [Ilumatobacteraceae bacterium]
MWVRIQEIRFDVVHTDAIVDHIRDTAIARYSGHDYCGFRLLLDRPNGTALEVSYWASLAAAQSAIMIELSESAHPLVVEVLRTDHYELAIDAG